MEETLLKFVLDVESAKNLVETCPLFRVDYDVIGVEVEVNLNLFLLAVTPYLTFKQLQ
ncbi:MAG: hypothetical protein ACK55Z_01805 [bacterium]